MLRIGEVDGGMQLPGRYLRLGPAGAAVVGIEDVPPVARRDQTFPRVSDIEQQAGSRPGGFDGIANLGIASLRMEWRAATQQRKQAARGKQPDEGRETVAPHPTGSGRHRAGLAAPEDGLSHNNPLCSY